MSRLLSAVAGALTVALASFAASATDLQSEKVVKEYMAAWNAHDAAQAAQHMTDDVIYYDASIGEPVTGRDAAQTQVIEVFLTAVPDAKWEVRGTMISSAGQVAFEWVFSGTNSGPWPDGTAATGKHFDLYGASIVLLKDGKIGYQGDYYDALNFYRQLGLME